LEKFNGHNFHTWKLKIQLQMMHKNLWGLVKGTKATPTDPKQLIEWEKMEDITKSINGLSLSNYQLHLIDLEKPSIEIWEQLSKIFGEKDANAKFSLKLQLLKLKMNNETSFSTHINDLKYLIRKLGEIGTKVDNEDAKEVLLNSLCLTYDNAIFTLIQLSSRTMDEMIATLFAEEKRMKARDTKVSSQAEITLFSKGKMNKNKTSVECFYC